MREKIKTILWSAARGGLARILWLMAGVVALPVVGHAQVCNGDPVIAGSDFTNSAWTKSGWDFSVSPTAVVMVNDSGTASLSQNLAGVSPGAKVRFTWIYGNGNGGDNGTALTLTLRYAGNAYWTAQSSAPGNANSPPSSAQNGATCVSGCEALPAGTSRTVEIRLPTGIPVNGALQITAQTFGVPGDDPSIVAPISVVNTGICLAKTSLGATGTFNFTTTGVDTTMGGGGTTARITTTALNAAVAYDASSTRTGNQPLLVKSPGATANVTIAETPATGFTVDTISCSGVTAVRSGNSITIANVPLDTLASCTFVNRGPIINFSKALGGTRFAAGDNFSVAIRTGGVGGTVVSSTTNATTTGSGATVNVGTGSTGAFYAAAGTTYTLTEAGTSGANLANYNATLTCTDAADVTPAASLPKNEIFDPAVGRAITPVAGADLSCVVTNTPVAKKVTGRVFLDNGVGAGIANDGILNGGEGPLSGVTVRLTNCAATVYSTGATDATGGFSLVVPAATTTGAALCVEQTNLGARVSTGASIGGTALPSGSAVSAAGGVYTYARSGTPDRIAFSWNGTGHDNLNFGDVDNSTFAADSAKAGLPGSTVTYAHTFTAGTAGQVSFSVAAETATPFVSGWVTQIFSDSGCTGGLQPGAAQLYPPTGTGSPVAFAGKVCVVARQFIPATAPIGASNKATLRADLDYANANPALGASFALDDTTTVSGVALELRKEVRNVTQGAAFGVNNQARSGETLEYRVSYTNNGDAPIRSMTVSDTTPGYTTFVASTTGTTPGTLTACVKNTPANATPAAAVPCADVQAAGGVGAVNWRFTGFIAPGGSGFVLFQVKVD